MKHTRRRPESRALSSIFTQTITRVPNIIIIKGTNVVSPIPQCCPIQCKVFPKQKIDCGVFDNLRLPPLLSKSTRNKKTTNDFKFNITRRLLTLTPAQCHEVSACPCSSKVTSSLKGISSAGLLENFLPHWESDGCYQSSRASRKILLVSLEGCDRVTDIDCTECTCSGQM